MVWCAPIAFQARLGDPGDLPDIHAAQALFEARSTKQAKPQAARDTALQKRLGALVAHQRRARDDLHKAQEQHRLI